MLIVNHVQGALVQFCPVEWFKELSSANFISNGRVIAPAGERTKECQEPFMLTQSNSGKTHVCRVQLHLVKLTAEMWPPSYEVSLA